VANHKAGASHEDEKGGAFILWNIKNLTATLKKTLCFIYLVISLSCSGQGITNLFQGGYENYLMNVPWGGNKVNFISGQPIIGQEFRAIDYDFTGTNITDSSGNLIFATNGVIIMNNVNDTMVNGTGLKRC
jgi:hypothetical protein